MYFVLISIFFFVEAEIDSAAELIDFLRFNCHYTKSLMRHQPISVRPEETLNRLRLRSLEGFIASVTPFNFTAIAGNLAYAPAIMVRTACRGCVFLFFIKLKQKSCWFCLKKINYRSVHVCSSDTPVLVFPNMAK
jgi:hypothetical protein